MTALVCWSPYLLSVAGDCTGLVLSAGLGGAKPAQRLVGLFKANTEPAFHLSVLEGGVGCVRVLRVCTCVSS